MSSKELEQAIIQNYERDEQTMILIFAQWCINNDIDPVELYSSAYPQQLANEALQQAIELTVSKEESEFISDDTVIQVLSLFDNEELAFAVTEQIGQRKMKRGS